MSARNKLVLDARWLYTGIGTYTFNLLRQIKTIHERLHLQVLTQARFARRVRPFCDELTIVNAPIYTVREQFAVPWVSRGSGLLHVPHYNLPLLHRGPLLITIADLTHLLDAHHRRSLRSRLYAWPMLRLAARRAQHIFTVSEYSKRRIVERLGVPPEKITVAYNGVSPDFSPLDPAFARRHVAAALGVHGPYILYVGNLKPHKNVGGLLRAFARLRRCEHVEHTLLIVGDDRAGTPALKKLAARLGISVAVVLQKTVPHRLLLSAYCGADLLVLPSFEEGFGLPVLEAMACETPVACSRAASLPEVAGDAAVYFDPHSEEDMAAAITRVLHGNGLAHELRARGRTRAAQFTWERSARLHDAVYRQFLN